MIAITVLLLAVGTPSVTACYEASVVTSKFDVARACIAQDPYEVYPVPESCQAVCNDAFYNDMVANAWQCRLDSEYSPNALFRKTDATSDNYVSSLQELTALSDACEDYHMPPFVATTSLTEPPLPFPTPSQYVGRPRECETLCSHVEKLAAYNITDGDFASGGAVAQCFKAAGNASVDGCEYLQYFCGNGGARYAQLAKCYQCRLISAATNYDWWLKAASATSARHQLDDISTGCAFLHTTLSSQPLYTTFPLPSDTALAVSVSLTTTFGVSSSTSVSNGPVPGEATYTPKSGARPTAGAGAPAAAAAAAAVGLYVLS